MKKIVIDTKYYDMYNARSKARIDANKILESLGWDIKYINVKETKNKIDRYKNIKESYKQLLNILSDTPNNSLLLFQYPFDSMNYKFSQTIKKISNKKNLKTIVLIHDINSIRISSKIGVAYYNYYIKEIKFLNNFDFIICHNSQMKGLLIKKGILDKKIIALGLFDYLVNDKSKKRNKDFKKVIIAGNLSQGKSGYVYKLIQLNNINYHYNLYGSNYNGNTNDKIIYKGKFMADEPCSSLCSGFGLVWDGSSICECDGSFGKYLMYNNPHKISLYLACGLPVIVWSKSALAPFVKENGIGICVSNLDELNKFFNNVSFEDYKKLLKKVSIIKYKVQNGYYLKNVVKRIENIICKK